MITSVENGLHEVAEHGLDVLTGMCNADEFGALVDGSDAEIVKALYLYGDCDYFAVALHRLTGWDIVAFGNRERGSCHRLVRSPDGRLLDAAGWTDLAQLRKRYRMKGGSLSRGGGEELASGYLPGEDGFGFDPDLKLAVQAVRNLPWVPFSEPWFREAASRPVAGVDCSYDGEEASEQGGCG